MRKFLSWYKRKPKTALPRVGLSLRWSFADRVFTAGQLLGRRGEGKAGLGSARPGEKSKHRADRPSPQGALEQPGLALYSYFNQRLDARCPERCALGQDSSVQPRALPPDIADGRGSAVLSAPEGRTRSWKWSFVFYCLDSQKIYQCGCLRWDKHKEKLSNTYELTLLLWWISGLDFLSLFIVFFVRT